VRLGIDGCCWSNRRGYGRFTRELVSEMAAMNGAEHKHELVLVIDQKTANEGRFPKGVNLDVVHTREQPIQAASSEGRRGLGDLWRLRQVVAKGGFDAFFFPTVYSYYPIPHSIPSLVTFHDATPESYAELIFPNRMTRWAWNTKVWLALRQATRLLTVSGAAKEQIADTFGYARNQIDVTTEGTSSDFRTIGDRSAVDRVRDHYGFVPEAPLILYVGGISPHKNLDGLICAVSGLAGEGIDSWQLGLVGDYRDDSFFGCYSELQQVVAAQRVEDRVNFTGYVSDEDLVALYNAATLVVLPSFSEGFGLSTVEAMACGAPVVASRRASLQEVLGPAGLYFDPEDVEDMRSVIAKVLKDPMLRESLIAAGQETLAKYSWTAAAQTVLGYLEKVENGVSI